MQLGTFTKDPKTGVFTGSIVTLSSVVDDVQIVPRTTNKRSDRSPDYDVFGPTGSDFGSGWNQKARETGKPYISLVLSDPAFNNGQPLRPILAEGDNNQWVMAWEAPDPNRAPTRPGATPAQTAAAEVGPAPGAKARTK